MQLIIQSCVRNGSVCLLHIVELTEVFSCIDQVCNYFSSSSLCTEVYGRLGICFFLNCFPARGAEYDNAQEK